MTKTGEELWNDINFINKRIREQYDEIRRINENKKNVSHERWLELLDSAAHIALRFRRQKQKLIHEKPTN